VLGLPGMAIVSWLFPQKAWRKLARMAAPVAAALALPVRDNVDRIAAVAGDRLDGNSARDIQLESMANFIVGSLRVLRDYRPGGWQPEIELRGAEHIDAGLRNGRGVILWVANFHAHNLVAKMAFHRAGYPVSHLSLWRHGYSDTRFGARFLNPIRTTIEERYLRERVVIAPAGPTAALIRLRRRLRANGVVSITTGAERARSTEVAFLDGTISVAAGAPSLAYHQRAALLPVFSIEQDHARFVITVAPPLVNEATRSAPEHAAWAARELGTLLEPYVRRSPGQWRSWFDL